MNHIFTYLYLFQKSYKLIINVQMFNINPALNYLIIIFNESQIYVI